jgi:crossover junction endodeoxyribonuclease RuvC
VIEIASAKERTRMLKLIVGIDPGGSGAAAVLDAKTKKIVRCLRFGKLTLHEYAYELFKIKNTARGKIKAIIENVHAMPKQGVSSSFKFGRRCGEQEGILVGLAIPYQFVTPQIWQRDMKCCRPKKKKGVKPESKTKHKQRTRARAQQLYPSANITHATADAVLIARWLCQHS